MCADGEMLNGWLRHNISNAGWDGVVSRYFVSQLSVRILYLVIALYVL